MPLNYTKIRDALHICGSSLFSDGWHRLPLLACGCHYMCWVSPTVSYGLLRRSYSWSSVAWHTLLPWISAAPFANSNSPWKLLTSNPISSGFLRCLSVFALPFCNMFEFDQSLKSSVIKSSARHPETCRVYFIMGCSDSRRTILGTVAAAMCVLALGPYVASWPPR